MSAHARTRIALALSLALTATVACTSAAPLRLQRASTAPAFPSRNFIGEAELTGAYAGTAYEAIQRLRPTYLSWTRQVTPYERRLVFVDGIEMGGVEVMGRYGTANSAGVIVITTKLGARR
jgi:hypothetical protein